MVKAFAKDDLARETVHKGIAVMCVENCFLDSEMKPQQYRHSQYYYDEIADRECHYSHLRGKTFVRYAAD